MVGWVLLALLGADDWECRYEGERWGKAGLEPPCRVLVGEPAAQLAAAQQRWGLTPEQARCALQTVEPKRTAPPTEAERERFRQMSQEEWERFEAASHFAWRHCAEQWPGQPVFWRAVTLSWNGRARFDGLFEKLPATPLDGGRALADELLDLEFAPSGELAAALVRAAPTRLISLLTDPRVDARGRFELALGALDARAPGGAEWEALAEPLVFAPLLDGHWVFAAEQWLRLPEALRIRVGGTVALAPLDAGRDGSLRPALALGLIALGKPDEARRIKLAPREGTPDEPAVLEDAVGWHLTNRRTLSAWDAAIASQRTVATWEVGLALMPFFHPHEQMFFDTFVNLERYEARGGRDDLSTPVAERLRVTSARCRDKLKAQLHFGEAPAADAGVIAAKLPEALPSPFVERTKPWKGAAPKPVGSLKKLKLPGSFWPVRAETQGKRTVVLALSQRLDPVGEVSPGGYWLLISRDGGRWEALYLSLGDHHPFHALDAAKVPLLDGDDVVRLAMEEAPLDERSISFPPIGLSAPTKRPLVVLEAPLAALRRDTDRDGLTDLVEARLLLDPKQRDTDGDGVIDGDDATPRLDDRLAPTPRAEMLNAFFEDFLTGRRQPQALVVGPNKKGMEAALGRPRGADLDDVRFLTGAAKDLAGLRPLIRLITLDEAELEAARARYGVFYPMDLELTLDGADHGYLEWSEGWRGGAVRIDRQPDGRLEVTPLSSWIT